MEFNLLGPLEVRAAGGLLDVGPPQQRRVLAALAFDAGRPVPVDTLVDRVWGADPPQRARQMLYVYITRIRRLLREAANGGPEPPVDLVRRSGGYALDGARDRVDLYRFRDLVCRSREPAGAAERAGLLREALALWRGEPLADLPGDWPARVRQAWRHEHLDTVTVWACVESGLGNTGSVIAALAPFVEQFPGNEAVIATMMRVLHAAGRSAEALAHYDRARRYLTEQLGLDPGGELQDLHRAILRGEPADLRPAPTPAAPNPAAPTPAPAPVTAPRAVPAQLPLDVRGFAGRCAELDRLDAIAANTGQDRAPVAVVVVCGTAGVGKSALAVHWAHRVAARFPGGQLHVNLRGFDPGGSVVEPADALRRFLDSLGVPAARIPPDLDGRVGLYRSLLTDRRTLVVLDNARDADQVRPLLPGAPGSVVIVTSRNQLAGLVAAEGAHVLVLDLLSAAESRQLLARRLGHDRVDRETTAVDEIVTRCSRLPLALAIVAARAAMRTDLPLAALAEQLHGALDPFTG